MTNPAPEETRPSLAQQFGQILRQAREARGLSLRDMASEVGAAHITLHQYERGQGNPTLKKVQAIADQYDVVIEIRVVPKAGRSK